MEDFEEEEELSMAEILELIQQIEEAQKNHKSLVISEEAYDNVIQFYQENREFKRAISVIESALELYPYSSTILLSKAEIQAEQNQFAEALKTLELVENLDNSEVTIYQLRADIFLAKGDHPKALEIADYALSISEIPMDICDTFLLKADIYEDLESYEDVIKCLENALKIEPQNEEAYSRMWYSVELTSNFIRSEKFHQYLVDEDPYNYFAWFNLGHAFHGQQKFDQALEAFEFAIAINEKFDLPYIFAGDILFQKEDFAKAIEIYHEALKVSRNLKEIYYKMGECYQLQEDLHKARHYLRKSISIDPQFDEAHAKLGEVYAQENNFLKAISSFERALKLFPENLDYLSLLADAFIMNEETEKAIGLLETVLEKGPKNKMHYIELATAYYGINDYRKAFDTLTEATIKFPEAADIYFTKFVFYKEVGNRNEALVNLQKGLILNYEEHTIIFDFEPKLEEDMDVINLLEQYKPIA